MTVLITLYMTNHCDLLYFPAMKTALALGLALAISTVPALAEYNQAENLVLADCGIGSDGSSSSRHMFYYKASAWSEDGANTYPPDMDVYVPWDGSYPWRVSGVEADFPNGDHFKVEIGPSYKDPEPAGFAWHKYDPNTFLCFSYHKDFVHQLSDGPWCSSAYVCNHKQSPVPSLAPTPTPPPKEPGSYSLSVSTNKDFALLDGNLNTDDVIGKVSYSSAGTCDESILPVSNGGDSCTIKFRCHGNIPGKTTPALVDVLKQTVKAVAMHQTLHDKKDWNPCKTGRDTCIGGWDYSDRPVTKIPLTLSAYLQNGDHDDQGELSYEMSCSNTPECDACKAFKNGSGLASLIVSIMESALSPVTGAIGVLVNLGCTLQGC